MPTGFVKWYNLTKGFGYIARDGGGRDLYVGRDAVENAGLPGLRDGQRVSFTVRTLPEGRELAESLVILPVQE
jgi:cold shock protein